MGAMNELFAFFWELAQAIWENFNCAEGKIIVGALINFFLLIGTIVHLFGKDPKGALVRAFIALFNSAAFSLWASLHQGGPSFFTAFRFLGTTSIIVVGMAIAFALFAYITDNPGGSTKTERYGTSTTYDQYGRPIELRQVGGHYEDAQGISYDLHGSYASAQVTWMETEDGESVQVLPNGGGYYSSYGHSYRMNSRGRLEEC